MKIGLRLAIAFGTMIVLIGVVAGGGLWSMTRIKGDLDTITKVDNAKTKISHGLIEQVLIQQRVIPTLILLSDPVQKRTESVKVKAARETYLKLWDEFKAASTAADAETAAQIELIEAARLAASAINGKVMILAMAKRESDATALLVGDGITANQKWIDAVAANVAAQEAKTARRVEAADASFRTGWWAMGGIGLAAAALGLFAGGFITITITRPINYARECALRMANGDLSQRVERRVGFDGKDESSQLIAAMQTMHDSICEMVSSVNVSASGVASASQQIASGNLDLSSRTEQQAASLEQTAATMDQLTSTVRQNADSTQQAVSLAVGASEVATRGGSVMEEVVQTMSGIDRSSRKIADIIGVIDSIAFQTNILALNAAVEAARAGEQGRGFAVVASEVRSLAHRSSEAAREIKALIGASVEQVSAGSALVQKAGVTMSEIVQSIGRVNQIMSEIRNATGEQANGIAQVGSAVNDMDRATQQNAALVEESAAAAESLNQQAQLLMDKVSRFRLAA